MDSEASRGACGRSRRSRGRFPSESLAVESRLRAYAPHRTMPALRRAVVIFVCAGAGIASAQPQPAEHVAHARGAIAGRVLDDNAKPVAGASVSVGDARAISDADGRFAIGDGELGADV